jgi:uncharacterized protein YijF (DUF1287 family)
MQKMLPIFLCTGKQIKKDNNMKKILLCLFSLALSFPAFSQSSTDFDSKLCKAAIAITADRVTYDGAYFVLPYPNGDVPANKGVCTDVVIRAYRKVGIDLQKEVHEDIGEHFDKYPKKWGLSKPDKNIDHRRVPNLMTFFARFGSVKKISGSPADYKPGEIVTWDLGSGLTHIGLVIDKKSADGKRCLIVHNIGNGQEISDCLFSYKISGHYHYPRE